MECEEQVLGTGKAKAREAWTAAGVASRGSPVGLSPSAVGSVLIPSRWCQN